jgi:L-2-hydroxyglutarate oxidase LhgO
MTATSSAATKVQIIVIGAGVIGLAVARTLARAHREVLLLDRASTIGAETSSRNSGVIHAGLYYPNKSLKAKFCVRGKQMLYQYLREHQHVHYKQCGKLIVATQPTHQLQIQSLHEQAAANNVETRILFKDQVASMEPELTTTTYGALWSPSTGIVDTHAFMVQLLADAETAGATLALNARVENANISDTNKTGLLQIQADGMWISCESLINCSGLWADHIARLLHSTTAWQPPRQYFCRGTYVSLQGCKTTSSPFQHLIYPVPDPLGGLGVHATVDLEGRVKFGPNVDWLPVEIQPDDIPMQPNPAHIDSFFESIRQYWPNVKRETLFEDYAGVRPKLSHPTLTNMTFQDFQIVGPKDHGVGGLVHLFGIESPGLTSSMAIAEHVKGLLLGE